MLNSKNFNSPILTENSVELMENRLSSSGIFSQNLPSLEIFQEKTAVQLIRGHVPAAISDRAGVHLEEDQADARLGQLEEGIDPPEAREVSIPPDRIATQVRSDNVTKNVRHERLGKEVRSNTWLSRMCHDWQSSPSQSLGHMQGQDARRTGEE